MMTTGDGQTAADVPLLGGRKGRQEAPCVHELFEEQVARAPAAVAVHGPDAVLTYAELNARANRLARALRGLGVGPETRVAICLDRRSELVVALLAVLKAGGAYVPLDPAYPVARLRFLLSDSAPIVLLTDGRADTRFPGPPQGGAGLDVTAATPPWRGLPSTNLERTHVGLMPDHLAYLIYTSGSTGTPKGVMVAHRGLCNLALEQIEAFAVERASRVLQVASFSFDACVSEVMMTLCQGATLYLLPPGEVPAGDVLSAAVRRHAITHVTVTPTVLATIRDPAPFQSVRTLILAGEALPREMRTQWSDGRRLVNGYGPTETTVCATLHVCRPGETGTPPIGRPIAHMQVHILDGQEAPVPAGGSGELYVGGVGVARGYWGQPALTADRFVPDPFSGVPGARLYRTGDLGRAQADGMIEFLGRRDFQVKVRGYRIDLGEIEASLAAQPGVREAVVLAREETAGDKRLIAYYTSEDEAAARDPETLRAALAERLPEHMVPSAYVRVTGWPLTPNGKLDRRSLPAPDASAYPMRRYEAPVGPAETAVADVWRRVLGLEQVGRHDDFFALGGHSLLAILAVTHLQHALRVEVTVRDLLARPVLKQFAEGLGPVPSKAGAV